MRSILKERSKRKARLAEIRRGTYNSRITILGTTLFYWIAKHIVRDKTLGFFVQEERNQRISPAVLWTSFCLNGEKNGERPSSKS